MTTILISGIGVAGPTLAYWLLRYGFTPVLVEHAPALRTGGYMIDFWGAGFEVAARMEMLPRVREAGYQIQEVKVVNRAGRSVASFPVASVVAALESRCTSLPRGDLASAIYGTIADRVETIFNDSVDSLQPSDDGVVVAFQSGATRRFDLVAGADGLHSRVRALAFGPQARFERYLGLKVAAFTTRGYRPRDELTYVMYSQPGREIARCAMRDDRTMFLFTFVDPDPAVPATAAAQQDVLRAVFRETGWESARILETLEGPGDFYFDRVSQIDCAAAGEGWSKGRTVLVGDAAACVSLLGGQGSALAMTEAYILAGELHRAGGDYQRAFNAYERTLIPFLRMKQKAARGFAGGFAPRSALRLWLRNRLFSLLSIPAVARMTARRGFRDSVALPIY